MHSAIAAVVAETGYSHRRFLLSGVSPGEYRRIAPRYDHHVPIAASSDPFKTLRSARAKLAS